MKTITRQLIQPQTLFWFLVFGIVIVIAAYVYAVFSTTFSIVEWQEAEEELAVVHTEVSELEFKYITLKNSVTIEYAYERGFVDVTNTEFLARHSGSNVSFVSGLDE